MRSSFTATRPGLGVVEAYVEDKKARFEIDIIYILSGVITDAHGEVLPGVTIVFTEDLDPVLTYFQGCWQKACLQEAIVVTSILKEHTFEPSSQRVESMNMAFNFVGTPLPPRLVELSILELQLYLETIGLAQRMKEVGGEVYDSHFIIFVDFLKENFIENEFLWETVGRVACIYILKTVSTSEALTVATR